MLRVVSPRFMLKNHAPRYIEVRQVAVTQCTHIGDHPAGRFFRVVSPRYILKLHAVYDFQPLVRCPQYSERYIDKVSHVF
jgi:hypothetical protein